MRPARNCEGEEGKGLALNFAWAPSLRQCPWSFVTDESWSYISMFKAWKNMGLLPYPGDIGDQPFWVFQALEIVGDAVSESEVRAANVRT